MLDGQSGEQVRRGLLGPILLALVCLMLATARANSGVPMLAIYLPPASLLLIPIILIEAAHGTLRWGVPFRGALKAFALANVVSTIIGVPLCWAVAAGVELICCGDAVGLGTVGQRVFAVTVQAPWLIPYETDLWWMVPAATAVLTVLFCGGVRRNISGVRIAQIRQLVWLQQGVGEFNRQREAARTHVNLPRARLSSRYLAGINLSRGHMFSIRLEGADLAGADLGESQLWFARLQRANLQHANLRGALLFRANLALANLSHADRSDADLEEADLSGAILRDAIVS